MATEIKYNITADEKKAVSALKKVGDAATSTGKIASSGLSLSAGAAGALAGALAGVYAAYKLVNTAIDTGISLAKRSLTESMNYINVETRLASVLKASGNAAGFTTDQLTDLASAYQNVTSFSDDAVIGAQTLLATFQKITGNTFIKATEAAMDLASVLGKDLPDAALMVGKALASPADGLGALSKAGIRFTQDEKDALEAMVYFNREAEAQAYILSKIESSFKGTAKAIGETFGGRIDQLINSFADLYKELGFVVTRYKFFGDVINIVTGLVKDITSYVRNNREQFAKLAKDGILFTADAFVLLVQVLGPVIDVFNALYRILRIVHDMASIVGSAIFGSLAAISEFAQSGVYKALDALGLIPESVRNIMKAIVEFSSNVRIDAFKNLKDKAIDLGDAITSSWIPATEYTQQLAKNIKNLRNEIEKIPLTGLENIEETRFLTNWPKEGKPPTITKEQADALREAKKQAEKDLEDARKYSKEAQESLQVPTTLELALMYPEGSLDRMRKERVDSDKETKRELLALDIQYYRAKGNLAAADLAELENWYSEQKDKYAEFSEERIRIDQIYSERFKQLTQTWIKDVREVGDAIQASLTDNITEFLMGTKTAGEAFRDLIAMMARELFKVSMTRMFSGMATESGGGFGNILVGLLGGLLGGGKAAGGPVSSGRGYLVGERGPELFIPRSSGTIIPNGGGSGGIVINSPITVNSTGNKTSDDSDMNKVGEAYRKMLRNAVKEVLVDEQRPRGMFNRGYAR